VQLLQREVADDPAWFACDPVEEEAEGIERLLWSEEYLVGAEPEQLRHAEGDAEVPLGRVEEVVAVVAGDPEVGLDPRPRQEHAPRADPVERADEVGYSVK